MCKNVLETRKTEIRMPYMRERERERDYDFCNLKLKSIYLKR